MDMKEILGIAIAFDANLSGNGLLKYVMRLVDIFILYSSISMFVLTATFLVFAFRVVTIVTYILPSFCFMCRYNHVYFSCFNSLFIECFCKFFHIRI